MRELVIGKNDADQRVDKFLSKAIPLLPKSLMYKSIRNKKIKVNRKRCEIAQRLQEGDRIQLFIAEEFFQLKESYRFLQVKPTLSIVYEDEHLLIVDKPVGLLAHSDTSQIQDTLLDRIQHYLYKRREYDPSKEHSFAPSLCHRIDRNTQGIVIAAKDAATLRSINEQIRLHTLEKKYLCIVEGHFQIKEDILILYHRKEKGNKVHIQAHAQDGYQETKTAYKVLKEGKGYSLVEINLLTGKSHQIRAVMSYIKHPLLGDRKYGAKKSDYPYQALCAYQITFPSQNTNDILSYMSLKQITLENIDLYTYFEQHFL